MAIKFPAKLNTNNAGEIVAVLTLVQNTPKDQALDIYTDSKWVMDALTGNLKRNEDHGWLLSANANILKSTVARLREHEACTLLVKVKGHFGNKGNDGADSLANMGA